MANDDQIEDEKLHMKNYMMLIEKLQKYLLYHQAN